ncbi:MAG TPA: glycosyltransferase [Gemmatimonadales bacterium]|nr:glycosyltransferase [Gemmatimonadales bacterium]
MTARACRIALVHRRDWPGRGPSPAAVTYNAHALASEGAEVHLFVGQGSDAPPDRTLREHFSLDPIPGLHVHPIGGLVRGAFGFDLKAYARLVALARRGGLDAIATRDAGFLRWLPSLRRLTGARVYYETHNVLIAPEGRISEFKFTGKRRRHPALERRYVPRLDGVICILESQAELYAAHVARERLHVVHPGGPEPRAGVPDRFRRRKLGYVGSLEPDRRDLETFFAGVAALPCRAPLVIIGGQGKAVGRAQAGLEQAGIADRTEITGWVSPAEVDRRLAEVSVGVMPMEDSFYNRYLTAPMKLYDYWSRGIPVVAADLPSVREFMPEGEGGLFYTPGNARSLAAALERLLCDEATWQACSVSALRLAERGTWRARARRLLALGGRSVPDHHAAPLGAEAR